MWCCLLGRVGEFRCKYMGLADDDVDGFAELRHDGPENERKRGITHVDDGETGLPHRHVRTVAEDINSTDDTRQNQPTDLHRLERIRRIGDDQHPSGTEDREITFEIYRSSRSVGQFRHLLDARETGGRRHQKESVLWQRAAPRLYSLR